MSLNECTEHSSELLRLVSPDKGVGFAEVARFNSYQDLGSKFSRRTFGDCQESCDLGIAIAFITFCDVRRYGQTAPCELVAETEIPATRAFSWYNVADNRAERFQTSRSSKLMGFGLRNEWRKTSDEETHELFSLLAARVSLLAARVSHFRRQTVSINVCSFC